jgi:hypothetical protein
MMRCSKTVPECKDLYCGKRRILLGCWVSFNDPELTKMDLAPAVEFDWHCAYGNVQAARPGMPVFQLSAKTGDGIDECLSS